MIIDESRNLANRFNVTRIDLADFVKTVYVGTSFRSALGIEEKVGGHVDLIVLCWGYPAGIEIPVCRAGNRPREDAFGAMIVGLCFRVVPR